MGRRAIVAQVCNALLIALILWTILLFTPLLPLTEGVQLLVSGVFYGAGCTASLVTAFMPELPRLRLEKGRMSERSSGWIGLVMLLGGGVLLALEAEAMLAGKPPVFAGNDPAGFVALATAVGCVFAILSARMQLCWNEEGFALRTALGNDHHFSWEADCAYISSRGGTTLTVGRKHFSLPGSPRQVSDFKWYARGRRIALVLPIWPDKAYPLW